MEAFDVRDCEPLEWSDLWAAMDEAWRNGSREWFPTTENQFDAMLGAVPPRLMGGGGFLCGEPWTHDSAGRGVYAEFVRLTGGRYAARYSTAEQFRATCPSAV